MSALFTTRMSSNGQVVIPDAIRQRLRLKPGTEFVVTGGRDLIMLEAVRPRRVRRADEKENAFWIKETEKALADAKRRGEEPIPFEQVEREIDAAKAKRRGANGQGKRARTARSAGGGSSARPHPACEAAIMFWA